MKEKNNILKRGRYLGVKCLTVRKKIKVVEILNINTNLQIGDFILEINSIMVNKLIDILTLIKNQKEDICIIKVLRNNRIKIITTKLFEIPYEQYPELNIDYLSFYYNNIKIRAIMSYSKKKSGFKRAIIFFQGIECKSMDFSYNNCYFYKNIIYEMSKNDFLIIRVDLFGNGDSLGDFINNYSFYEIVDLYQAAILNFNRLGYEIYLFGFSIGGVIAPLLAKILPTVVKGIVVFDTIISSLYSYLLKNRLRQELLQGYGKEYLIKSYNEYKNVLDMLLIQKKKPKYILRKNINAKKYFSGNNFMYHTYLYVQQISDLDLLGIWEEIKLPVLIIVGEKDYTIDYDNHIKLFNILKEKKYNKVELLTAPINHFFMEDALTFSFKTIENINEIIAHIF